MALYSFKIKKDKYQLDLLTTDKTFLVEQFELWVKKASEYAKKKKANECKELVNSQIKAEAEITQKNIDEQLSLYDFSGEPIQKLDIDTVSFIKTPYLGYDFTEEGLEVSQNILKKVRQINK